MSAYDSGLFRAARGRQSEQLKGAATAAFAMALLMVVVPHFARQPSIQQLAPTLLLPALLLAGAGVHLLARAGRVQRLSRKD